MPFAGQQLGPDESEHSFSCSTRQLSQTLAPQCRHVNSSEYLISRRHSAHSMLPLINWNMSGWLLQLKIRRILLAVRSLAAAESVPGVSGADKKACHRSSTVALKRRGPVKQRACDGC